MRLPEYDEEPLDIKETRQLKRITTKGVLMSVFDAFNLERGGIYTLKALFKNPGKAVKDYLGVNRFNYTPPFRILVISTAIVLFLIGISESATEFGTGFKEGFSHQDDQRAEAYLNTLSNYLNLIIWSLLPFFALFSFLFNKKKPFNYAEHLVFQTYMFCISNVVSFAMILDYWIDATMLFGAILLISTAYYVYGYKQFTSKSWLRSISDALLTYLFAMLSWIAVATLTGVAIIGLTKWIK